MKLHYSPGAGSLADRIARHEGGLSAEFEKLDLKTNTTEAGADFRSINPKGYVPAQPVRMGCGACLRQHAGKPTSKCRSICFLGSRT